MKKLTIIISTSLIIVFLIFVYLFFKKEIVVELPVNVPYYINVYDELNIPSVNIFYCDKYFKKECQDITKYLTITNNVNVNKIGDYHIDYLIEYKKIKKVLSIKTIVDDLEAPNIKLKDTSKKYLCPNYNLNDINDYIVIDNYDESLEQSVKKYIKDNKLYYSITDSHGNTSETSVEVEVGDNELPSITLNGYDNIFLLRGSEYKEEGFIAYDNCDGDLTDKVTITNNVDTSKTGTYEIIYSIKDSSGNKQTKIRTINVYDNTIGQNVKKNGRIVYLTFDDGPNAYTKNILEVLDKYQVKSTFFVTNQFPAYQYLIKEIFKNGHSIAIHTYSHNYKNIYSSETAYFSDLNKMDEIIFQQTDIHTKLVRFPGGGSNTISKFNPGIMTKLSKLLKEKGYIYFDWNVDSGDTSTINSDKIANNVINGMKNNKISVVLMHDIKYANKAALEKIIYYGLTNGYTFLPLDEKSPTVHHNIRN